MYLVLNTGSIIFLCSWTLQRRHNGRDGVSNHQCLDFSSTVCSGADQRKIKLCVNGICEENPPTGGFPSQWVSNVENVSIWWRHNVWLSSLIFHNLGQFYGNWPHCYIASECPYLCMVARDAMIKHLGWKMARSLQWRHNERDGVSNHQPHDCLLNLLFRQRSKKTSKLRVTGLCAGNSPVTGGFRAQMANKAENVSIWWRQHVPMALNVINGGNQCSAV